jgi:hypothetical protein
MTATRRKVGWVAAATSLTSLVLTEFAQKLSTYHEILAIPCLVLLSICGSIVAGRLLSPRWYYIAIFWAAGILFVLPFVLWY